MAFITWLFILVAAGAASFFASHPTMAFALAQLANSVTTATTLCAKLVAAVVSKQIPNITADEYNLLLIAVAVAFIAWVWSAAVEGKTVAKAKSARDVKYTSVAQAKACLMEALPDGANVVIYEDVTGSNWMVHPQLHALGNGGMNPYQVVRMRLGPILADIDTDKKFLYFAFGSGPTGYGPNNVIKRFKDDDPPSKM